LEPVVARAIDLDEQSSLGHALPAAPIVGWPSTSRRSQPRSSENSLKCRTADEDLLFCGEQFGEMAVVDALVETMWAGQLDDPNAG
jgi:hypothetical protein